MAGVKLPRIPIHGLDSPRPLIGPCLPVLASDWSPSSPGLSRWGLVSQESNIRFMPQQQISMTLNFHNASSILAFLLFIVVYLDLNNEKGVLGGTST